MNFWQRKLLAFLHDPPHKALDIKEHEKNRATFLRQAGLIAPEAMQWFDKPADWQAAAADRHPAFDSNLRSPFGGASHPFKHPLGGSEMVVNEFPTPEALGEKLQLVQPHGEGLLHAFSGEERDQVNFFLHWRRWAVEAAEKDWRSAFQPADTRLPDHPIWLHNGIASALQGCDLKPAFLIFQMGPVQEFIEQARSTRDLWSGSYLLSWLTAHAIKSITDAVGPDAVIFPFLRAQPLFDLLHRDAIYRKIPYGDDSLWSRMQPSRDALLVPNLPNKLLALVPASRAETLAAGARLAAQRELAAIAEASWSWIHARLPLKPEWRDRFDRQVASFLNMTWQVYPWDMRHEKWPDPKVLFGVTDKEMPYGPNPGLYWEHHYAAADLAHAARRNTRDFAPWMPDERDRAGSSKDTLSGKEEIIGDAEDWWPKLAEAEDLRFLFRSSDKLGAMNLIKKVWHRAHLDAKWGLDTHRALRFESVPDIAAAEWLDRVRARLHDSLAESAADLDAVVQTASIIHRHAEDWAVRTGAEAPTEKSIEKWLAEAAPDAFLKTTWEREKQKCEPVRAALARLYKNPRIGAPPGYVAVLALDGDRMGEWISGKLAPPTVEQFSSEAREALGGKVANRTRPLSPSYHLQFGEALANFALYLVDPVVRAFNGQVMYAGGDDVLAMVPAARALDCAEALRAAFRGQPGPNGVYEVFGSNGGFVRLNQGGPTGRLIVPGPRAELSAGIALGHRNAPLQELVRAARAALKTAKADRGRAAFSVNVFKRSGERMEWGANWNAGALTLYREFLAGLSDNRISGKFAYALGELLTPYRNVGSLSDAPGFDIKAVIPLEFDRVLDRQTDRAHSLRDALRSAGTTYLANIAASRAAADFPGLFHAATFISRGERE